MSVKRAQAALAIVSITVGAAVMSMLLNLYGGVDRKMTQEFRAFGPNVVLAPGPSTSSTQPLPLTPTAIEGVKGTDGPCHPDPAAAGEGARQFVSGVGTGKNNCADSSPAKSGGLRMTDLSSSPAQSGGLRMADLSSSPAQSGGLRMTDSSSSRSPTADGNQEWRRPESTVGSSVMDQAVMSLVEEFARQRRGVMAAPLLYAVVHLKRVPPDSRLPEFENVVAVGTDLASLSRMNPGWRWREAQVAQADLPVHTADASQASGTGNSPRATDHACVVGARLASRLRLSSGDTIFLATLASSPGGHMAASTTCHLARVLTTGSSEDDQVFLPLEELQRVMGMTGKISLVELRLDGDTSEIESAIHELAKALPGLEVRPIRQIVYSEGRVLGVIRWFLLSVTALILSIIVICLMATMTAIVLERRKDIGMMKALGASDHQVMRLFLAEGVAFGLVGGCAGFLAGSLWAYGLAHHLFGVTLNVIWWTLPLVCGLAVLLELGAAAFPVRIVRAIHPAAVLKGE